MKTNINQILYFRVLAVQT